MQEDIKKIIKDGTYAPSGENCQPWKFIVSHNKISVYNLPELDQSLYNSNQKGSYTAHGALIENIVISSAQHGYKAQVDLFPNTSEPNLVSIITLNKAEVLDQPLYEHIVKRHTNRKDHKPEKLSSQIKEALTNAAEELQLGKLSIIDDQSSLDNLGKALAVNEQVIFENKKLHDFFYEHILWNEEDQHKAGGFYVKTLEFLPHQLKGVKLFKNWFILKVLNKLASASKMIVKENAEKYAKSAALAIIMVPGNSKYDFVNAGRTAERVWLTATKLGLSVHPCTGVLYFMENMKDGGGNSFSPLHQDLIKKAYSDIETIFNAQGKTIPMLFRLGYAEPASAKAFRMEPNITFQNNE